MATSRPVLSILARSLGRPLEVRDDETVVDAIVVLGAPAAPGGALSAVCRERVDHAVALFRRGIAPVVLFTGGGTPETPPEAPIMADYARGLGLPEEAIRVESQSRNTGENAAMSASMLRAEGHRRVWVVSQPFHLRRARRLFRRAGLDASARPMSGSLQHQNPAVGLRWIAREYAAWLRLALRRAGLG